ncbi:hypothetical protein AN958_06521 [Leucoagaricus sp. SymC.cos]|nr:hypothetical protein AN958_06521 [Leucoagaricus sp. SymC.cos]
MQLKSLFFFASIISIALATTNLQDLLDDISKIGPKVIALHNIITSFQTERRITDLYAIHSQVNEVIDMVEKSIETAKGLDGRVETETAQDILDSFRELVPLVQAACKAINVQDILISVGQQGVAVAKLDVLYMKQTILELEDVAFSRVPLDCIEEARGLGDEIKAALDVAVVAFD